MFPKTQDITSTKLFSGVNRLPLPGGGGGGGLITDGLLGFDDAENKEDGPYAAQVGTREGPDCVRTKSCEGKFSLICPRK